MTSSRLITAEWSYCWHFNWIFICVYIRSICPMPYTWLTYFIRSDAPNLLCALKTASQTLGVCYIREMTWLKVPSRPRSTNRVQSQILQIPHKPHAEQSRVARAWGGGIRIWSSVDTTEANRTSLILNCFLLHHVMHADTDVCSMCQIKLISNFLILNGKHCSHKWYSKSYCISTI